ncbi:aspartate--tRNA ligase [Pyrus ussuriensis x Pyrus communis]|uniref:aspartate--tRNA ligase n=1 Tax=Pyrus ussuriensis x Pyrus communis TaxID=2448454 RepID=A0A5N5GGJ2_9ROSA|nr:aspartate--tRNA ligase [Pyrus ussuriensis x Pyrus communis]
MASWKKTITTPFRKACTFFNQQPGGREQKKSQLQDFLLIFPSHPSSSSSPVAVDCTQPARSSTEPLPSHCRLTQICATGSASAFFAGFWVGRVMLGLGNENSGWGLGGNKVEVQVRKLYCVSKAAVLPINIEDVALSDVEIEKALQLSGTFSLCTCIFIGWYDGFIGRRDTRLNNRVLDLRTPANQGIFRIQSQVGNIFRQFLISEGFFEIHSPKLIAGSSAGGVAVFRLNYKGQDACLAQSPQLHKQMAICGDFGRIFEIGHVFRAEDSFTHRHLCEFTCLDVEMEIKRHYFDVMHDH